MLIGGRVSVIDDSNCNIIYGGDETTTIVYPSMMCSASSGKSVFMTHHFLMPKLLIELIVGKLNKAQVMLVLVTMVDHFLLALEAKA